MTIQEAIGIMLRTESLTLPPLVSDRIYWIQPPPSPTFPLIIFRKASHRDMAASINGASKLSEVQIDFQIFSRASIAEANEVAEALTEWLEGWTGDTPSTDAGFQVYEIMRTNEEDISERDLVEQGLYAVGQSYMVKARAL